MRLVWSNAGYAALVSPDNTGTSEVLCAQIAIGRGTTPAMRADTALEDEIKRIDTISGQAVAEDIIHVVLRDETSDTYGFTEFALIADDGTQLARYAQAETIIEKATGSTALLPIDVTLTDVDATQIVFPSLEFLNPPATRTVQGVVELVDDDEARGGSDGVRAMTSHGVRLAQEQFGLGRGSQPLGDLNAYQGKGFYEFGNDAENLVPGGDLTKSVIAQLSDNIQLAINRIARRLFLRARVSNAWYITELLTDQHLADDQAGRDGTARDRVLTPAAGRAAVEQFGIGKNAQETDNLDDFPGRGIFDVASGAAHTPPANMGGAVVLQLSAFVQLVVSRIDESMHLRTYYSNKWQQSQAMRHTGNTVVDSNGFIKAASPVVRVFADRVEALNGAQGVFERVATGHYRITGTTGFATEGWYIETPRDANGRIKRFVEYNDDGAGTIDVWTFEPDRSGADVAPGAPADIPAGRWIDLRLRAALS